MLASPGEFGNLSSLMIIGCQWYVPVREAMVPGQVKSKLRVCGDYSTTVNLQLETYRYPIPLPEDLMRKLRGEYCFTKVDLPDAYNKIKLGPESQRKLALRTHRGVLLQLRLPYEITSAPARVFS